MNADNYHCAIVHSSSYYLYSTDRFWCIYSIDIVRLKGKPHKQFDLQWNFDYPYTTPLIVAWYKHLGYHQKLLIYAFGSILIYLSFIISEGGYPLTDKVNVLTFWVVIPLARVLVKARYIAVKVEKSQILERLPIETIPDK